jgi:hypothetical protein
MSGHMVRRLHNRLKPEFHERSIPLSPLQPFPMGRLPRQQKGVGESACAAELEGPKILEPVAIGNVGILGLPLSQSEQVLLGDLTLFCTIAQVCPLFSREPFPLNFRQPQWPRINARNSSSI